MIDSTGDLPSIHLPLCLTERNLILVGVDPAAECPCFPNEMLVKICWGLELFWCRLVSLSSFPLFFCLEQGTGGRPPPWDSGKNYEDEASKLGTWLTLRNCYTCLDQPLQDFLLCLGDNSHLIKLVESSFCCMHRNAISNEHTHSIWKYYHDLW